MGEWLIITHPIKQMNNTFKLLFSLSLFIGSNSYACKEEKSRCLKPPVKLVVLGIAQDAGYPQLNCYKPHCMPAWNNLELQKSATSLALIDVMDNKKYLFEATPDIKKQLFSLQNKFPDERFPLAGIFLTHAHMGHYTGLMHLGREAAGTSNINVFAMPKMKKFLSTNGPWSQLVDLKNIVLNDLHNNIDVRLSKNITITPILVPHRDEYSETVGYKISGPKKKVLFIPDINKWNKWELDIREQIKIVDYALLDATFYANGEIPNRDMSEIPHPFVTETMQLLSKLPYKERQKVIFIHFNHSNPLLQIDSDAQKQVLRSGFRIANEGLELNL